MNSHRWLLFALLAFLNLVSVAQDAQQSGPAALSSQLRDPQSVVQAFLTASGWSEAARIKTAVGRGTIQRGDAIETFTIKLDKSGRVRTEIVDPHIVMIAGPDGGVVKNGDDTRYLTVAEATQHGASVLLPIFTVLGEAGSPNTLVSVAEDGAIAMTKGWHGDDKADRQREEGQLIKAIFDPTTNLLQRITVYRAPKEAPSTKVPISYEYSSWSKENDILLPHHIEETIGGKTQFTLTFSSIQLNADLNQSEFHIE
jgi:hypothetical protein